MTAPLATIAEALIEFILSLLRDPQAAQELNDDPETVLARKGLTTACADDVRAVAPVVIDRPDVAPRTVSQGNNPRDPFGTDPNSGNPPQQVAREIMSIVNNFTFDNRTTIVDQSVNQSIWAGGDVTQVFDQEALVASGDGAIAAGDDAVSDQSDTNVTVGDVAIGNTDTSTTIDGSFNEGVPPEDADADAAAIEAAADALDALPATIEESVEQDSVPVADLVATEPDDSFDADSGPIELEAPPEPEFDEQ